MRMTQYGWENADDKMRMTKCEWQNANDNVRMIKSWWGKINYVVDFFSWRQSIFNVLGREKWNIRQQNSIITVWILLFPLMAGGENIVKLILFSVS